MVWLTSSLDPRQTRPRSHYPPTAFVCRAWWKRVERSRTQFGLLWTYCHRDDAVIVRVKSQCVAILSMFKISIVRAWRKKRRNADARRVYYRRGRRSIHVSSVRMGKMKNWNVLSPDAEGVSWGTVWRRGSSAKGVSSFNAARGFGGPLYAPLGGPAEPSRQTTFGDFLVWKCNAARESGERVSFPAGPRVARPPNDIWCIFVWKCFICQGCR